MKRISHLLTLYAFFISLFILGACSNTSDRIILAYVTSSGKSLPDPQIVTHINYAFGHVDSTFCKVDIENEERLSHIVALKREAPHLKVLLSIGGWGSGRFSEMAADEQKRTIFAFDCRTKVNQYGLDGIDIDWEYPTSSAAGISSSPDDTRNYTLLIRDLRKALGPEKLLTLASVHNAKYIDFKAIVSSIDFINVMAYDINCPPFHHAALYRSSLVKNSCAEEAIKAHLQQGIPANKIVLGIPFYGRGINPIPNFINYDAILAQRNYTICWDSIAKVPYLTNGEGELVCSYESPKSIIEKCNFIIREGLKGIMYWAYDSDGKEGTLRKAAYEGLKNR